MPQHRSQTFVEPLQRSVGCLERRADEVRRNALPAALELTLVKEAQTGRQVGDDGRGFVHGARECGGRPRLVMILHEARELPLVVEPGVEMLPHRPGVTLAQPISWNSWRHPGFAREICCATGPVCQTLRSHTQSNPIPATRSSSASGMSSSVLFRPRLRDRSVSQTRVLIWYSEG